MNPKTRKNISTLAIWVLMGALILYMISGGFSAKTPDEITLQKFVQLVEEKKVSALHETRGSGLYSGLYAESNYAAKDLPNRAERRSAITQYSSQSLHWLPEGADMEALVNATEGFSYADIEYVIKDLAQQALLYGDDVVTAENLLKRLTSIVPYIKANPANASMLRQWGAERAVSASHGQEEVCI